MPRDGSSPAMSLEERALRHADDFFTGPEKWHRGSSRGPGGTMCVGMALVKGFAFKARLVCECRASQLLQLNEVLGFKGLYHFADWNDGICPNFATLKAHLRTRIEYYTKKRLADSYIVVVSPGRQVKG